MRILELNFEKHWRGGERQTIYGIQGLVNAGQEAYLLCRKGSPLAEKARQVGINLVECESIWQVIRFLLTGAKNFDLLHCQTSNMLTYCIATKWLHKKPVVLSRRVSYIPEGFFTLFKYKRTNRIIAISNTVKNILFGKGIRNVGVISDIAVPITLDKNRALNFLTSYNCNDKKIIATMAAFEAEKDPMTMVEAIKKLFDVRKDFIFFHFGQGSLLSEIKIKIREYGLENVYHTPGFVDNVQDFFAVMTVFTFSSIEEGLGSSILDAFLYKVPVASTNGGGLQDLVTSDRGLVSETKDARQLADNIICLLDNESLKQKLLNNAFTYVHKEHSMVFITAKYLEEFKNLVDELH